MNAEQTEGGYAEQTSYAEADAARRGLSLSTESGEDEGRRVDPSEETDGLDYSGPAEDEDSSESPGSIGGGGSERIISGWDRGYGEEGKGGTMDYPGTGDIGGEGSER
ncbi:MAG TPA: hypothetical protein VM914_12415 [Pyrinomonadaceae bacterium]|jgi:hypothetical protein|nr:hypothetical protein [Pyrinomonadaceae bacterium]